MRMDTLERRKHFRIDDNVDFNYVVLSPDNDEESALAQLFDNESLRHHHLNQQFKLLETQSSDTLIRLSHEQPDVAALFNQLERKIDMLSHSMLLSGKRALTPVNLSLGGIAFYTKQAPSNGQAVKLRMTTMPRHEQLICNAKVIYSKRKEKGQYKVIFKFQRLSLEQENLLNRHILHVQSQSIASQSLQSSNSAPERPPTPSERQSNDR